MSAPVEQRSPALRFLDAFFQERNIKWMLGIGLLIVLGSSLMLVTAHWDDYTPLWKSLVLLGYTAGIYGLGQLAYYSLALRKTGTGLMALTVLLIPLTFLGAHWVNPLSVAGGGAWFGGVGWMTWFAVNCGFSVFASRRIFGHFLRRTQPTFLVCYGLLALAGAFVPSLPAHMAPFAAPALWSLFAVGAIKVNRHVFWLTEEHRLPRVYGFFPILLLGGMFLALFAVSLAPQIPLPWVGFGLVMTAVPVLLTADALAYVFQQRSVSIPTPLPWSIVLPIVIGLGMTITGVCLSGIGFPATYSLPTTAALAAMLMAVTARRTQRSAFVWLMLGALLAAYQTAPVFFQEAARAAVQQGAAAVHEPRLPLAFYGLTYLPLLTVLSGLAAILQRRDAGLFSAPLRRCSIGLGLMLLLTSVTHVKAIFPVGLALSGLFGLQWALFRDRRLLAAGVSAFVLAGIGFNTFVEQVLLWPRTAELPLLAWTLTAGLLLWPGRMIDRRTSAVGDSASWWQTAPVCQWTSLAVLAVAASAWLVQAAWFGHVAPLTGLMCGTLLMVQAWQLTHRHVGRIAIAYLVLFTAVLAADAGWPLSAVTALESLVLFGLWIAGRNLRVLRSDAIVSDDQPAATPVGPAQTLRLAGSDVALYGLGGITMLYVLPMMALAIVMGVSYSGWVAGGVSLIWVIDAARLQQSTRLTVVGWLLSLGTLGVLAAAVFDWKGIFDWYPTLGTLLPFLAIGLLRRDDVADDATANRVRVCAVTTLALVAIGSLLVFTLPMRVAGVAALIGLLWSALRWPHPALRTASYAVAGWQGLSAVLQLTSPRLHAIVDLSVPLSAASALPVALAAVLLSILWNGEWLTRRIRADWCRLQSLAFRGVAVAGLWNTLLLASRGLSVGEALAVAATFLLLAAEQLWTARRLFAEQPGDPRSLIRRRDDGERHGWLAEGIAAAGIGYLLLMGVLTPGGTISLFAPLMFGAALW
ncbi:MAG: hypothetical protein AB7I48_15370, partial [Planctomycetaceae bacterium]